MRGRARSTPMDESKLLRQILSCRLQGHELCSLIHFLAVLHREWTLCQDLGETLLRMQNKPDVALAQGSAFLLGSDSYFYREP